MAATTASLPILSYGHTMPREPKYRKAMKLPKKQPTLPEKRETIQKEKGESSALKKVGAFGVSVKKTHLTPDHTKHDRVTSPIKEVSEEEEIQDVIRRLPGVEISLTKKIKRSIMLRHATNTDTLASSDRQVLDDLRQGLRTGAKGHSGTKSVLEAMGDPKLRESRFYYEPLKKFLAVNERQTTGKTPRKNIYSRNGLSLGTQEFPSDLRLVNVTVPPSQQHFNTPVDSRHQLTTSNSHKPSRGTKHGYPIFPKVSSKLETRDGDRLRTAQTEAIGRSNYSLSPASGNKNDSDYGRKTDFSLPSISLRMQHEFHDKPDVMSAMEKPTINSSTFNEAGKNIPSQQDQAKQRAFRTTRPRARQPNMKVNVGAKMTSSGKSHLIGPMNKMEMIVEYSKLLQSKVINYQQYITKLSKLSLHKIDLGNSGLRHYHIVRDGTTGMKPRLARVDIYPSRAADEHEHPPQVQEKESNRKVQKHRNTDTSATNRGRSTMNRSNVAQSRVEPGTTGMTPSQLRLSRVSIGEGIPASQLEYFNTGFDIGHGEYLTYDDVIRMQGGKDIDRYRDAHRPNNSDRKPYHWTHIPPSTQGTTKRTHLDPSSDPYTYTGKLLPNSREIKKRLNFSYPSYDVMVDGNNQVTGDVSHAMTSSREKGTEDSGHDPDYLAITLEQPRAKMTSPERPAVTSSLSVHEVTIPTEVKVITGRMPHKNITTTQRKGLVLGANKDPPKSKEIGTGPRRASIESLNITPVAITSSSVVNANPASNRSPYYISQDDFVTTGTDGVLQNHLSAIYKSINKAKVKRDDSVFSISTGNGNRPGKNSPPDVIITSMNSPKNTSPMRQSKTPNSVVNSKNSSPSQELEKIVEENAKLLQPGKRFPPPNTPPPKSKQESLPEPALGKESLEIPTVPMTSHSSTSSEASSSLLIVPSTMPDGSPPPTAFLLKSREEEATSVESDDANEFSDIITVNLANDL